MRTIDYDIEKLIERGDGNTPQMDSLVYIRDTIIGTEVKINVLPDDPESWIYGLLYDLGWLNRGDVSKDVAMVNRLKNTTFFVTDGAMRMSFAGGFGLVMHLSETNSVDEKYAYVWLGDVVSSHKEEWLKHLF